MEFIKLTKKEDFQKLNKGDTIIVKWSDYTVRHTPRSKKVEIHCIELVKKHDEEIICRIKGNIYFNYGMFVEGLSCCEEVYLVKEV